MSPTELNIEIAKRLGWTLETKWTYKRSLWRRPDGRFEENIEPWSSSLDAIHRDLLPVLNNAQWARFVAALSNTLGGNESFRMILKLTPDELCRAFLSATNPTEEKR